ncbi:MAG: sensor histidine kinase, partial [Pyrinomonadaceae bacterium]
AQLQTLKMQLHPHFLFNTLNSISSLLERDKAAADKMIARLGDFLRLTLDERSGQEISLQRELEFLECYLAIERTRFQDKLKTRMRIGQGTLDAQIPSLVLLPVVENAIKHGICARTSQGRIEIISERQGDYLLLEVTDDGPGLKESGGQTEPAKFGLGLSNTQARLKQLYGDDGRLELRNNADSGLTVTILIPFKLPLIADSTQTVGITHDQFIADQSFNSRRRTIGTS